jgi:hypothetical protein
MSWPPLTESLDFIPFVEQCPCTAKIKARILRCMDNRDFELLVERIERAARARPRIYKAQVFGLAVLGYAFLAALIAVLVTVIVMAILAVRRAPVLAIKLVVIIGAFLLVVVRALWVELEAPEGRILTWGDAPDLLKLLDRLRQELQTPAIHTILVTSDFNAAVAQIPRLRRRGDSQRRPENLARVTPLQNGRHIWDRVPAERWSRSPAGT